MLEGLVINTDNINFMEHRDKDVDIYMKGSPNTLTICQESYQELLKALISYNTVIFEGSDE